MGRQIPVASFRYPATICTFTLVFIQLSLGCLPLPRPWSWAKLYYYFRKLYKNNNRSGHGYGADQANGWPSIMLPGIYLPNNWIHTTPSPWAACNQPTNQPLHQPSSSAAILWFMMESKQMPEHRGFSFWNLEYDDGDDGLFMQIACGVFPLALMDNWTCEWVRG